MLKAFKKLWNDKRGNALIIFGASLPMIMGAAGLASDTIQWALWKRELQRAADSAAIAGVYAKAQGAGYSDAVTTDLARNNDIAGITINTSATSAPSAGAYTTDGNAVRVSLQAQAAAEFQLDVHVDGANPDRDGDRDNRSERRLLRRQPGQYGDYRHQRRRHHRCRPWLRNDHQLDFDGCGDRFR